MTTHLIVGASGQVGEHLVRAAANAGIEAIGTYYSQPVPGFRRLDVRCPSEAKALIAELRPTAVYLPASMANVDYCELHQEESYATNVGGVCNIVKAANEIGARLVYFSSDYVFDGSAGPYREDDPANPVCEYGRQKVIAEHHVALHANDYLIVRTTVVYGWERQGKNFVYRVLRTLKAGEALKVPVDQVGNPTYAPNLAEAVVVLTTSNAKGVYHVVGPDRVDRYTFACEVARVFGLDDGLIQPVSTRELGQVAPRPLNAGMVIDKAARALRFPLIGYRDGLRAMSERGLDS